MGTIHVDASALVDQAEPTRTTGVNAAETQRSVIGSADVRLIVRTCQLSSEARQGC